MKKIISIAILFSLFISCKKEESQIEKAILSKTFFDFDKIEHYKLKITNTDISNLSNLLVEGEELSKKDSINEIIYMFVTNLRPKMANEKEINTVLSAVKNQKKTIDNKYFQELKSDIFIEKKCNFNEDMIPATLPLYKDIFIFWKNKEIIGLAKLNSNGPFLHVFQGTTKNTDCFGENGEIQKLQKILKHNN